MDFDGKTVLVTGATSGIGRACAEAFLAQGAVVGVNHYNDHAGFQNLRESVGCDAERLLELGADVRDKESILSMVGHLVNKTGQLDVLVNNAGISLIKPFLDITEDEWDNILATDLKSVFLCCQAAIPHLLDSSGSIVNVASELALSGRAQFTAYTAAKGGIISLTRSLAREFAPAVRVNAVAPGPTKTPLLEKESQVPGHQESLNEIPLGRYAEPEEIAQSILFLASNRASYYCGDVLSPNGGTVMS